MFDVRARQAIPAHDAVPRCARPAAFDRQRAHAFLENHLPAHHGRRTAFEAMILMTLNLNCRPRAVRICRQCQNRTVQPISRRIAQQIIAPPQIQIARNVRAT